MIKSLTNWLFHRHGTEAALVFTHRRIFTLPSRAGWLFTLMLVALLLASINYQLSLGYGLSFWVASMAWVSLHVGYANLAGLRLHSAQASPVFCGEMAVFEFQAEDTRQRARYALRVSCGANESRFHIEPGAQHHHVFLSPTTQRGWHPAPRVTIDSRYPLGLWRVWSYWQPAAHCLVYPRPEDSPPPLPSAQNGDDSGPSRDTGQEAFDYVRAYQPGDSMRRIAWKTAARTDGEVLASKMFAGAGAGECWFEWSNTGTPDQEHAISRLTAWVLQAHARGLRYGLRLPTQKIAPDHGAEHRDACLKALALC